MAQRTSSESVNLGEHFVPLSSTVKKQENRTNIGISVIILIILVVFPLKAHLADCFL